MAPFAKQCSLFLLLTLLSSLLTTHARDSQFFNKIPSTTTAAATTTTPALPTTEQLLNNQQLQNQEEQEPDFKPENENSYGLYSHESGQLPPSATTTTTSPAASTTAQPLNKHLPKNYNPVAYVTVPEDTNDNSEFTEEKSFSTNPTNYNNAASQNYYNTLQEQEEEPEFRNYPSTTTPNYGNGNDNEKFNYMGGGSSFNSQPQGLSDTRLHGGAAFSYGGDVKNGFQPQGMSDTRLMENGKYFYDVNNEKYNTNHPYESLKGVQSTNQYSNNGNYYGNRGINGNEFNNNNNENYMGGYQNQDEFQNEENYNMP